MYRYGLTFSECSNLEWWSLSIIIQKWYTIAVCLLFFSVSSAKSAENADKDNLLYIGSAQYHNFTCTCTVSLLKNRVYSSSYNVFQNTKFCPIKLFSWFTQGNDVRELTISLEISEKRHGCPKCSQYLDSGLQIGLQYAKLH